MRLGRTLGARDGALSPFFQHHQLGGSTEDNMNKMSVIGHISHFFLDVIAKVSSLKKIQQDRISYIGIKSFSATVILSQAGKDGAKKFRT
jgi:hypothetical protein